MQRAIRLARHSVTVLAMCMRGVAVAATRGLRDAGAKCAHALKNHGERKQQLERDAFHAGDTLRPDDRCVEQSLTPTNNSMISLHDCAASNPITL
jgi:hypothetical protein